jgi:hypothetical protein
MEVVASAALLAMVAVGVLSSFDVASGTSATSKHRAVAASIAQDDQERMRGLEVRTLMSRGTETRTVKAGPVTYTVRSDADLIVDSVDAGCTTGSGGIDYLKITSRVTWPGMRSDPVLSESLMAPRPGSFGRGEGGFTVQLLDRDSAPISGMTVGLNGTTSYSDTTDENGCAFFTYIPAGNYNVVFGSAGQVTPGGVSQVNEPVSVPQGAIGNKVVQYDAAGRLTASFMTRSSSGQPIEDRGNAFAAAHPNIPAPGALFFTSSTPVASIATAFTLFPFSSDYSVYAGRCMDADPTRWGQDPETGVDPATILLGPGGDATVTAWEPALRVMVRYRTSTNPPTDVQPTGARVRFYDNTCGSLTEQTTVNGEVPYPGMPYGEYDICADYDHPDDGAGRRKLMINDVKNDMPNGRDVALDILNTSEYDGSCPSSSP